MGWEEAGLKGRIAREEHTDTGSLEPGKIRIREVETNQHETEGADKRELGYKGMRDQVTRAGAEGGLISGTRRTPYQ